MNEEKAINKKDSVFGYIGNYLGELYHKVNALKEEEVDENQSFLQIIAQAHEEWKNAEALFHDVTDPDLIDHAIYKVEAARSRYIYLLKKAKEEGIRVNFN
ncbi:YaaL family protein [Alkaliphilus transvaalensis]|uniref:YaaL family protein n=1 Tax=Alkaliphilus transvaalensis TaxID=114628 RepID=UPI0004797D53|nr:YaaL family protein [Alkaliphilus transvaalensis]